ncbi:MAG: response regulator transcription factor, partial [Candidatus Aminicenantes bacterium RBG_16_66_30]
MKKILIIDDDRVLRQTLAASLESEGYGVSEAADGREGLTKALKASFDLIVLDVVMPAMGGLEVCRKLREAGRQVPVIVLSGKKKKEIDKVLGLELGGDDYMTKPFGTDEFLARVHAILRRSRPEIPEIEDLAFGDVAIDFRTKIATKGGRELHLTAREFS